MSQSAENDAEAAWIEYRNGVQMRTPWENHRRAMRRLRKRDFIAGYLAAAPVFPSGGIAAKVEASSLGTPEAKALRSTVSNEQAARVVARAKEIEREQTRPIPPEQPAPQSRA